MSQPITVSSEELETWADDFFSRYMDSFHITGATFAMVQNGKLILAKGYGYEDLERQIPIMVDRTVFQVGAISQLFTTTAILQLVDKGLINLEDDVNNYLQNFQIDNTYVQSVTIANLLTHTAGFEKYKLNIHGLESSDIITLEEYLKDRIPKRIRLPGEVINYSNFDYALLTYIIESVTNTSFSQYIDEKIFKPLEMNNSSFELTSHLPSSYKYDGRVHTYETLTTNNSQILVADALNTTAIDMAEFAIAHLQHGQFEHLRIQANTTSKEICSKEMWQQQSTEDAINLLGSCWNSLELKNGQLIYLKLGKMSGFSSLFCLFLDHNLGFFISTNTININSIKENRELDYLTSNFIEELDEHFSIKNKDYIARSKSSSNQKNLTKIKPLDYICNYLIVNYVVTLTYIYLWIFLGFLRPNLDFEFIYLPESIRYKSMALILIGVLIYQILRPMYKVFCGIFYNAITFLFFPRNSKNNTIFQSISENLTFLLVVLTSPILYSLTAGWFLFFSMEYIGIWHLSFSPLFLLISSYLTVISEKTRTRNSKK